MSQRIVLLALFVLAPGMLLPGLSLAQSGGRPSLPDLNRSPASMALGAFIDPGVPYPLELPAPGPSSKADLPPRAEEARQRGLKAASGGDWPGAVAAFKEANSFAHCSPPLVFNLGLAYQRGGWPVQAAMYYRAYLTALPGAPNAAGVGVEIRKMIADAEARAMREFEEAERLADALSATPSAVGVKSLRQIALEEIATYAYLGGLIDRGDALVRKAASQPGAGDTESKTPRDKHGFYAAVYSWDARRVDDIVARAGRDYQENYLASGHIRAHWMRGDLAQVRRLIDEYPSYQMGAPGWEGLRHRSYDVLETLYARSFAAANEFDAEWYNSNLMPGLEAAFWDGRPDIARRLAGQAIEYYRKFNPKGGSYRSSWAYIVPNSLMGDRKAVLDEMGRWKNGFTAVNDFGGGDASGNAALLLAASMPAADAAAAIQEMIQWRFQPFDKGDSVTAQDTRQVVTPLAYFALSVAKGDALSALKYLEYGEPEPADKNYRTGETYQKGIRSALRFAVATGRSQLALDLAERVSTSQEGLLALNRLALNPGADASVREQADRYATSACGGWRPADAGHARRTWRHLDHASWLNDETQYGAISEDAEKTAREEPEKLPAVLARHAIVLWMGAMAARLED